MQIYKPDLRIQNYFDETTDLNCGETILELCHTPIKIRWDLYGMTSIMPAIVIITSHIQL